MTRIVPAPRRRLQALLLRVDRALDEQLEKTPRQRLRRARDRLLRALNESRLSPACYWDRQEIETRAVVDRIYEELDNDGHLS